MNAPTPSQTKRLAIIGAGAAGLSTARHLQDAGIAFTIFEAGSQPGGLWVYDNDSGLSPAYRSLHINSEARVSDLAGLPFPADAPLYPDHAEMARYFHRYAQQFDLLKHIRFRTRVARVDPKGDRFEVTVSSGETESFDGVVVACGHQSVPRDPPEAKVFAGDYIHAHRYRVPTPYTDKRVLVIGPGNSGVDIAADICSVTSTTVLCARSPVLVMPRMMFGVPNSRTLLKLERPFLPWRARIWIRTQLTRIFHGRMEQWGFRTPKTRTHPISHPTLISQIAWGRVRVKPGIESVSGTTVRFVDGSAEEFDSIIAATGYTTALPFLDATISPVTAGGTGVDLYNRILHPAVPGLYFIGFFDVTGGSNIRMMDDQAQYTALVASGRLPRPSEEAMRASIEIERAWSAKQFPGSHRYSLELDPMRYRRRLAAEYRRARLRPGIAGR